MSLRFNLAFSLSKGSSAWEHSLLCSSPSCKDESARDLRAYFPFPLRGRVRGGGGELSVMQR